METPIVRLPDRQRETLEFALDALGLRSAFEEVAELETFALTLALLQLADGTPDARLPPGAAGADALPLALDPGDPGGRPPGGR